MTDSQIAKTILAMTATSMTVPIGTLTEKVGSEGAERARQLRWITPSEEMPGWYQASLAQSVREEMRSLAEQDAATSAGQMQQHTEQYEVGDTVSTVVNGQLVQVLVSKVENGKIEVQDKYGKPVAADATKLKMIQKGTPQKPKSTMPVIPS